METAYVPFREGNNKKSRCLPLAAVYSTELNNLIIVCLN